MIIKLTQQELEFLMKESFLANKYKEILLRNVDKDYVVNIDDDDASEMREACSDELPLIGFDIDYNPNQKGLLLESLIDKFFID